jgi:hypothetical protein
MRTLGFGLALAAATQLTLLTSPALAAGPRDDAESTPPPQSGNASTGWMLLGGGGALVIGGIVVDAIGGSKNQVSGTGAAGDNGLTHNAKTDLFFAGTTMIVAGVLAGIYGGSIVLAANARKNQDANAQTTPPPAVGTSDPVTKAAQTSLASAPTFVVPVVGARF